MRTRIRIMVAALLLAAVWTIIPGPADAQSFTTVRPGGRGGTWEFYLPLTYADSATVNGQNGTSVDINADWGFGLGFGYNFNDHFQLNGLFTWNSRSYDALVTGSTNTSTGPTTRYSNYMDTSNISLNAGLLLPERQHNPLRVPAVSASPMWTRTYRPPRAELLLV